MVRYYSVRLLVHQLVVFYFCIMFLLVVWFIEFMSLLLYGYVKFLLVFMTVYYFLLLLFITVFVIIVTIVLLLLFLVLFRQTILHFIFCHFSGFITFRYSLYIIRDFSRCLFIALFITYHFFTLLVYVMILETIQFLVYYFYMILYFCCYFYFMVLQFQIYIIFRTVLEFERQYFYIDFIIVTIFSVLQFIFISKRVKIIFLLRQKYNQLTLIWNLR